MSSKKVLIVDDDAEFRKNLADILHDAGYLTYTAASCAEAIESARNNAPNAALLELKLPDCAGVTLLNKIKEMLPDCYSVMMTAYADTNSAISALEHGASRYLQKPFKMTELLQTLDSAFATIQLKKEKQRAEQALKEREEGFGAIFNTAEDAIFIKDKKCAYTWINPGMEKLFTQKAEYFFGKTDDEIFGKAGAQQIKNNDVRVLKGETVEDDETLLVKGVERTFHVIKAPMRDNAGKITGLCGIARDITDRLWLESQLAQAQKMEAIGTLAGGIAHDFNNILGSILGYTELTLDDTPEGSVARRNLEQVMSAGHRAKNLVKQILTFSRKSELEKQPTDVGKIVKESVAMMRATIPATIEIRQNISGEKKEVFANSNQIHQILVNLFTNASYAMMEKGGVLEVVLSEKSVDSEDSIRLGDINPGRYIVLKVSDTGSGMKETVKKRIFEPFFTTKEQGKGTGMGLAVVYGIVKDHRGTITVESQLGKGATFEVYLPKIKSRLKKNLAESFPAHKGKERILFIDDEQSLVDIGRQMLERLGYEAVTKRSSMEALELFREHADQFDLIITDQTMPNITGDTLSKEFLRIRRDIPIIICTGYSELLTEEKAKAIGIREFVLKPIVWREMSQLIRRALKA